MSGLFGSGGLLEDWELDPRVQRGNSALSALLGHNPATSERRPVPEIMSYEDLMKFYRAGGA